MIQNAGTSLITADAALNTAGTAVRVFSIHIISGGGGGGVVNLRSGTVVTSTIWVTETGTVSTGKTFNYGTQGIWFPSGCFVDVDGNTTSVAVVYSF